MSTTNYMNSIVGLDTAPTPDQALSYMMATEDTTHDFPFDLNDVKDSIVTGAAHHMDRRQAPPQAPVLAMNSIVGLDTAPTPDQALSYMMASEDNPQSSGGKFIHADRRGNEKSNYPPQIGAAG